MHHWTHTHIGLRRNTNEDAMLAHPALGLFGVADGLGGHAAGEVASAEAVRIIDEHMQEQRERIARLSDIDDRANRDQLAEALVQAVTAANFSIRQLAGAKPERERMGTTFCGGLIAAGQALIVNVGDSRAYLWRHRQLHQLTRDHTMVGDQLRRGLITEEQAKRSSLRHILLKAIGTEAHVKAEILPVALQPGDRLLFCSDGVHGQLSRAALIGILADRDGARCVRRLIDAANQAGGMDNATAVLVEIPEPPAESLPASADERSQWLQALARVPLFEALDTDELEHLLAIAETRRWHADQLLFAENSREADFLVVLSGQLAVVRDGLELARLGAGEYVGELAFIDGRARSASVVAREDSAVLVIARDAFYQLLRRQPVMANKLLWHLGAHMASLIRELTSRVTRVSDERSHATWQ